jgi:hypothetical protein
MKARKFENVELNQTVTFEENGMIETGVVCNVEHNKFTLRALREFRSWDNNGVNTFYEKQFKFFKTGTKTHSHHTNGNAIAITGNV